MSEKTECIITSGGFYLALVIIGVKLNISPVDFLTALVVCIPSFLASYFIWGKLH